MNKKEVEILITKLTDSVVDICEALQRINNRLTAVENHLNLEKNRDR